MTNLFSSFDNHYFWKSEFILLGLISLLFSFSYSSGGSLTTSNFSQAVSSLFYPLNSCSFSKYNIMFFLSIFFMIVFINLWSVFPFTFPSSSQFGFVLFISLLSWISVTFFFVSKNSPGLVSHLIPEGSPVPLSLLLFLIEIVSSVIRPLTLSVRLVANILAGHLLMILLSQLVMSFFPSFIMYAVLNSVELFVALIQGYIFCTLSILYYSEVN